MAGSITNGFNDIFVKMKITQRDLEKAQDDMDLPKMTAVEYESLEDKGIDMSVNRDAIEISEGKGIFSYKKRPVVVYIKDQYLDNNAISNKKYNKYHLCYCRSLQNAAQEKRFYNRYVMVRRTKGDFWMGIFKKDSERMVEDYAYRRLNICQDCLRQMNWKGFKKYCGPAPNNWWQKGDTAMRARIVQQFSIDEFLQVMRSEIRSSMSRELKKGYFTEG